MRRRAVLLRIAWWSALTLGLVAMWLRYGPATATTLLTIVSGGAALTQVVTAFRWRSRGAESSTSEQIDRAASSLSWAVLRQWEIEAGRRSLDDPRNLPIRWNGARESGEIGELVRSLAAAPRRLIVVGEPGAGKTGVCVLLTLELLRQAEPPRIPILLQISSWNPVENLHSWLIRTVLENYAFLGDEDRFGPAAVRELLSRHRLVPILDGLDEMAENRRAAALEALEKDMRDADPFVLTCRIDEFEMANAEGAMRSSAVVRLMPVEADVAAGYLLDAAPDTALDRWESVVTRLAEDGESPIAEALRTPLMLFLIRESYTRAGTDPAELLELPDASRIQNHLLEVFPRKAFADRPPSPLDDPAAQQRRWDPEKAEQWLAALARLSGRQIAWWQIYRGLPRGLFVCSGQSIGAAVCATLGWLMFGLYGRPGFGALLGFGVGLITGTVLGLSHPEAPRRFVPRPLRSSELPRDLGIGLIGATIGGIIVGLLYGLGFGIVIGLVFGVAFGLVRRFTEPTEPREALTPANVLHSDRLAVGYAATLGAVVGALVGAFMGGVVGAAPQGLVFRIHEPVLLALLGGGIGALLGAVGLGLVVQATSSSGRFTTARVWMALRGTAPLRLMTFLADAHRLGVLRQVGPYYEFRHALLQERLAEQ